MFFGHLVFVRDFKTFACFINRAVSANCGREMDLIFNYLHMIFIKHSLKVSAIFWSSETMSPFSAKLLDGVDWNLSLKTDFIFFPDISVIDEILEIKIFL